MIRILFVIDTYIGGHSGTELHLYNLAVGLARRGFKVWVVQLSTLAPSRMPFPSGALDVGAADPIQIIQLPTTKAYGTSGFKAAAKIATLIRREHIDVVQSMHESADFLCASMPILGQPCVRVSSRRDMGIFRSRRMALADRVLNRRFDAIVAPSAAIIEKNLATGGLNGTFTAVIPNGVDTALFKPRAGGLEGRQALPQVDPDTFWVICVANLKEVKGHEHLLRALGELRGRGQKVSLLLVGDGPLRQPLESAAVAHHIGDSVHFLGLRDDVHALLPLCDALALPSLSEGLSNAILEGLACGLPIVTTRTGGNPESVREGIDGFLVEPGDAKGLADRLARIIHDEALRKSMSQAARQAAVERFSLDKMVESFDAFYSRLGGALLKGPT